MAGEAAPPARPRFDFSQPGAVQGFQVQGFQVQGGEATLSNPAGQGCGSTCVPPEPLADSGYGLQVAPTLHPGQHLPAVVPGPLGTAVGLQRRRSA